MPNFKRFLNYNLMPNTFDAKFDACKPVKRLKSSKHLELPGWKKSSQLRLQFANKPNPLGREVHKRICQRSVFRATEIRVEIYRTWGPFPRSSCLKRLYGSPKEGHWRREFSCLGKVEKSLVELILSMICTMTDTSDEKMWSCHFVTAEAFFLCLGKYRDGCMIFFICCRPWTQNPKSCQNL